MASTPKQKRLDPGSDWTCAKCRNKFPPHGLTAYVYSRLLCPECWAAWQAFGATAFRLFMGDTTLPPSEDPEP